MFNRIKESDIENVRHKEVSAIDDVRYRAERLYLPNQICLDGDARVS